MLDFLFTCYFSLQGCASMTNFFEKKAVDLKPYIKNWEDVSKLKANIEIVIDNDITQLGLCRYHYERTKTKLIIKPYLIKINTRKIKKMAGNNFNYALELVINHELEHCVKKRLNHIDSRLTDDCPSSILYTYGFGHTNCYKKHRAMYWDEIRNEK